MKRLIIVIITIGSILFAACSTKPKEQQQVQSVEEQSDTIMSVTDAADSMEVTPDSVEPRKVINDEKGKKIFLAVKSDMLTCYTQTGDNPPKKLKLGIEDYYEGFPIMYSYRYGNNIFLVGDLVPNSNGWVSRFSIYIINVETLNISFVADGAAVHFGKDGFKVAQCRLTNPDADCTADEIWVMHDSYYDVNGKKVREDRSEYDYERMEKEYGDSLVNAQRMSI